MRRIPAVSAFACITVALALSTSITPANAETIGGEQLAVNGRLVGLGPDAAPLPPIKAEAWVLADATTGEILAAKNAHEQRPPASTLKTLTALTVLPRTTPDQTWTATAKAANQEGSRVGLRPGKEYTLEQLWHAVFLPSANDAAVAVALANGGVKDTVQQMNETAQRLQAFDTVAKNPSGLDKKGQVSSAYDLALISRAGMQIPDFARYASTKKALFPDVKGKGEHPIYNTNRLLLSDFKGVTGVKTGFTSDAGRTYVGSATRDGTSLIVSMLGIRESTEDAARKLLSWGFKNHDKVTPVGTLVEPLPEGADPSAAAEVRGSTSSEEPAPATTSPTSSGDEVVTAVQPTSTSSAITFGGAILLLGAFVAGVVALIRVRLNRTTGRHRR